MIKDVKQTRYKINVINEDLLTNFILQNTAGYINKYLKTWKYLVMVLLLMMSF